MALRRWKPFFPAFEAIDTAIEAATKVCSRDKCRQVRNDLVEMLCDAADDDDGGVRAEGLCRLLDRAMHEALLTLRAVPVPVTPAMLAATDVVKAVGGLLRHEAGIVRAQACGVLADWRASIEAEGAALDTLLQMLPGHEVAAPVTGCARSGPETKTSLRQADNRQATKIPDLECPKTKKMPPGVSIAGGDRASRNEKAGDAKRKHPGPGAGAGAGGYYRGGEADDVKRRRKVPEMVEHRPRKMEQDMKRWTDERRFSTSTRHRRG